MEEIINFIAELDGNGERDLVGYTMASRIVRSLEEAGYVIVPKEPALES